MARYESTDSLVEIIGLFLGPTDWSINGPERFEKKLL